MERRFDMSDFERSLKDHADQFKMIPSKRVWNGIYNNLHPGSKWPSITVAILFLFTLITISRLNNSTNPIKNSANTEAKKSRNIFITQSGVAKDETLSGENNRGIDFTKANTGKNSNTSINGLTSTQIKSSVSKKSFSLSSSHISSEKTNPQISAQKELRLKNSAIGKTVVKTGLKNSSSSDIVSLNEAGLMMQTQTFAETNVADPEEQQNPFRLVFISQKALFQKDLSIPTSYQLFTLTPGEPLNVITFNLDNEIEGFYKNISNQDKKTDAFKKLRKRKNRPEWTFYVNPTISTVSFNKKAIQPSGNNSSMVVLSNQAPFKLLRNPRFGMEAGAEMSFKIDKKLRFITGFNFSYSGYTNLSNLVHPTYASLSLNDGNGGTYEKDYITHYGNGQSQGHVSLVNYNIEASIPLGVQLNIWGNEKLRIDLASLLEPTVLLKDNAYLISSDGRYYVNDPQLVRRTNLDGHFGSYITFIGKKVKWHLGPDFSYQLFSTYKNIYPAKEHLIDYGIRIGISK